MNVFETIVTRRSYREFTGKKIHNEMINTLLRAAFAAPTASNKQSWEFVVVKDPEQLRLIGDTKNKTEMVLDAGVVFVVCGSKTRQDQEGFLVQDASAATQNLLLAAEGLGLGAVWLSCYPRENMVSEVTEILNLPEDVIPITMVAVGYRTALKDPVNRFDPAKVHYNKW